MADPIATIETDIKAAAAKIKAVLMTLDADALAALGFAQEALPVVAEYLSAAAAVLAVACPQAAGPAAVLATALNAVNMADKYAVTAQGFLVHPSTATALNIAVLANPTNDQKTAAAVAMVKNLHPEMAPALADNAAHIAVQAAVAQLHHVNTAAPAAAPAPTA